ncbi:MAG TPA: SRPBCC family protein [Tepidisphaeraceae bacterium]|jgi:uncharacterized membrane protein YhaH (DUF805 family)|nr:SRPBCC family protein [Tepidisphaeraceae bacterium]
MLPRLPLSRTRFLLAGVSLFIIKFFLDHQVARHGFGRSWSPIDYLIPTQSFTLFSLPASDQTFFATMTLVALPFALIGLVLTLRRLRDAGLSPFLVLLFFVPVANLLFFLTLSLLPTAPLTPPHPSAVIPHSSPPLSYATDNPSPHQILLSRLFSGSLLTSSLIPVPFALLFLYAGSDLLGNYGWGLFIGLPFVTGLAAAILHGYRSPRTLVQCLTAASLSQAFIFLAFLFTGLEGAVCILMATPLLFPLALLGAALGYAIQQRPLRPIGLSNVLFALPLALPFLLGAESAFPLYAPTYQVTTSLEIDAPPEAVWPHVVTFPPLPTPTEWPFRLGIAYPKTATIIGAGPGAIRYCTFSTGSFVEPITTWNAPHLLAFDVTRNPSPLTEWSPYSSIHPPHLDNFLTARHGQFQLTPLPNGHTLLQGTTWYQHHLWPAAYWRLWSDPLIHHIHQQVLSHIKRTTEADKNPFVPIPPA